MNRRGYSSKGPITRIEVVSRAIAWIDRGYFSNSLGRKSQILFSVSRGNNFTFFEENVKPFLSLISGL